MLLTEYDEAATMELFKEEGIEIGREQGIIKTLLNMINKHRLTVEEAAEEVNMTVDEFIKAANELQTV